MAAKGRWPSRYRSACCARAAAIGLQFAALALLAIGVVAVGWAPIAGGSDTGLLDRAVVAMAAAAAMAVVYGLGLTKLLPLESTWLAAARRLVTPLTGSAAVGIVFVLGIEVAETANFGSVLIDWPAIVVVAGTLLGLVAASLAAAVLPGRDPLGLSERGRTIYVLQPRFCWPYCSCT